MKDKVKSFEIYSPKIKLPKKGHTIIELKDCRTGNKQVYEDDNMITKALEYYFANGGRFNVYQGWHTAGYDSLVDNYLGGIFLLDTALDEDEELVKIPSGVGMTANGATRVINNSNPPELGSFSANESGWIDGDYVQTYDYTNLQGNGTIACACLTSRILGYMGIGNKSMTSTRLSIGNTGGYSISPQYDQEPGDGVRRFENKIITKVNFAGSYVWALNIYNVVYDSSHASEHYTRSHKLTFTKHHCDLTLFNLSSDSPVLETVEITVPNDFDITNQVYNVIEDGKLLVLQHNDSLWTDENPIRIFIADETGLTDYTIGNKTGETLYATGSYMAARFRHGYFYIPAYISSYGTSKSDPYTLYKIDPSDSSVVEQFEQSSGEFAWGTQVESNICEDVIAVGLTTRSVIDIGVGDGNAFGLPVNCDTGNSAPLYGYMTRYKAKSDNPLMTFYSDPYNNRYAYLRRDISYIATINNLSTPVVKDDTKSMKVTYRLTF